MGEHRRTSVSDYNAMDEIIPNLWIGDLQAARNEKQLRESNIHSVLSAMRGRVNIHATFTHFQVQLDDMEDADAIAFFPQCIAFIEKELERGRGVLVHCQAGMSRSATIVAAYIMYSQELDAEAALKIISKQRPISQPNNGFLEQLDVFHRASYKVSRWNKAMRMYYLERALEDILNGDGSIPEDNMFAKFPRTPTDSAPGTPIGPRRRIRCKMCRQELATREHMLDHGQVGPETPASVAALSPAASRRPSSSAHDAARPLAMSLTPMQTISRRASAGATMQERPPIIATLNGEPVPIPLQARRLSSGKGERMVMDVQPLTPLTSLSRRPSSGTGTVTARPRRTSLLAKDVTASIITEGVVSDDTSALDDGEDDEGVEPDSSVRKFNGETETVVAHRHRAPASAGFVASSNFMTPMDLAAQLNANPKLAALRSPSLMGGLQPLTPMSPLSPGVSGGSLTKLAAKSPPLLSNNTCSGYFLEPMKWMESFLENGELAGKIICPNKKCGAKLGNYDWAGVCCSCKEWVTPGFCIHRSKVDEVVV